jgi:ribosomal protein L37AE/L43A
MKEKYIIIKGIEFVKQPKKCQFCGKKTKELIGLANYDGTHTWICEKCNEKLVEEEEKYEEDWDEEDL